jgi:hypothetical protein
VFLANTQPLGASRSRPAHRVRFATTCALSALTLSLGLVGPSRADRTRDGHADWDRVVLEADFVGILHVDGVVPPDKDGSAYLTATVVDSWVSTLDGFVNEGLVRIPFRGEAHSFATLLRPGTDVLVMVSGGPWQTSPFTFGRNTIFPLAEDGTFTCVSGNPLFGLRYGLYCSTQDKMAGHPLSTVEAQTSFLAARNAAAGRFPNVVAATAARRSFDQAPSSMVDRSLLGQQVAR